MHFLLPVYVHVAILMTNEVDECLMPRLRCFHPVVWLKEGTRTGIYAGKVVWLNLISSNVDHPHAF